MLDYVVVLMNVEIGFEGYVGSVVFDVFGVFFVVILLLGNCFVIYNLFNGFY